MENFEESAGQELPNPPVQPETSFLQQSQHMQHHPMQQYPMQHYPMQHYQHYPPMHQGMHPGMPLPIPLAMIHPQTHPLQVQIPPVGTFSQSPIESAKRKMESPAKKINFPVAKIKTIMKADDEVANISSDAVLVMAAATELFLQELADASWKNTAKEARKTILYKDVSKAVDGSVEFEFLNDVSQYVKSRLFQSQF